MICAACGRVLPQGARFCTLCGGPAVAAPAPPASGPGGSSLLADIRALRWSVLLPLPQWLREKPWTQTWVQGIAFLAFFPLLLSMFFDTRSATLSDAAWALSIYFGTIWGFLLYQIVRPGRIPWAAGAGTALFTVLIGMTALLAAQRLPGISLLYSGLRSADVVQRFVGYVFGVGILEESTKALPVYFVYVVQKVRGTPRESAFLGVISGLAFGFAEAVSYSGAYFDKAATGRMSEGGLLLAQFLRLISLPLLHALWAGVVCYFVGLAARTPAKGRAIVVAALGLLALVHGLYDTFSDGWFAFGLCLFSLFLFLMYMRSADRIAQEVEAMYGG